jgi:hypothetical protein
MSFDMTLKNLSAVANTLKAETEELNRVIADLNTRIAQTDIGVSVWLDYETILLDSKQAENGHLGQVEERGQWTEQVISAV